jgi:cleavage and polyadenylation specificity factor subunit 1
MTVIDRYTRWPEVSPLENITAEEVANGLLSCWFSRFGSPSRITTDQGRQFESQLFRTLGLTFGAARIRTTGYHPRSNGLVERFHRSLKTALKCHPEMNWHQALPLVLLGLRSAFSEDLQASPAELVYGEPLRLPGELIAASTISPPSEDPSNFVIRLRRQMENLRPVPTTHHSSQKPFVFQELSTCSHILLRDDSLRRPLQPTFTGPYLVLKRDPKRFTISINGKEVCVSIDRVKPAFLPTPVSHVSALNNDTPELEPPSLITPTRRPTRRVRFALPGPGDNGLPVFAGG